MSDGYANAQPAQFSFLLYLRHFFRHPKMGGGVSKRGITTIEYLMRRASRMYEDIYASPGVKNVSLSSAIVEEMKQLGLAARWKTRK